MYTVYGFTDDLRDFCFIYDSFVGAVMSYRRWNKMACAFIMREKPGDCLHVRPW